MASPETPAIQTDDRDNPAKPFVGVTGVAPRITQLLPGLVDYMIAERRLATKTVKGYRECIQYFARQVGDLRISELTINHFVSLKAEMLRRGVGESRMASIINAMKCLQFYVRDILSFPVVDITKVRTPKVPRREVTYLIPEELELFLSRIPLRAWKGTPRRSGYCLRALAETLTATGMRISEALALNRDSIDYQRKESMIIGKGNKQRTVFLTDRALQWIDHYVQLRTDRNPALFVSLRNTRLTIDAAQALFQRARVWAGIEKHVTPHMLRHTTATNLLRNGCPIGFIKEILGHERLETTCRYYLGIMTKVDTKRAHEAYSSFPPDHAVGVDADGHRADSSAYSTRGAKPPNSSQCASFGGPSHLDQLPRSDRLVGSNS